MGRSHQESHPPVNLLSYNNSQSGSGYKSSTSIIVVTNLSLNGLKAHNNELPFKCESLFTD